MDPTTPHILKMKTLKFNDPHSKQTKLNLQKTNKRNHNIFFLY